MFWFITSCSSLDTSISQHVTQIHFAAAIRGWVTISHRKNTDLRNRAHITTLPSLCICLSLSYHPTLYYVYIYILCIYIYNVYIYILCIYIMCVYIYYVYIYIYIMYIYILCIYILYIMYIYIYYILCIYIYYILCIYIMSFPPKSIGELSHFRPKAPRRGRQSPPRLPVKARGCPPSARCHLSPSSDVAKPQPQLPGDLRRPPKTPTGMDWILSFLQLGAIFRCECTKY